MNSRDEPDTLGGYVYALVDPITYETRYIGYTRQLTTRWRQHLYWAEYTKRPRWIHNWINKLSAQGLTPICLVLARGSRSHMLNTVEPLLIAQFKADGADLVNQTGGGPGTNQRRVPYIRSGLPNNVSPDGRRRMSENGKRNATFRDPAVSVLAAAAAQEAMRKPGGYYESEKHREVGRNMGKKGAVTRAERSKDPAYRRDISDKWSEAAKRRNSGGTIAKYEVLCINPECKPAHPGVMGRHFKKYEADPSHGFAERRLISSQ